MATPRDNTEVFRMLKDVKDALYFRATPASVGKRNLSVYRQNFGESVNKLKGLASVATKLDFSFLEDSAGSLSEISNPSECNTLKRKLQNAEAELLVTKAHLKDKEGIIGLMGPANKKICLDLKNELDNRRRQSEIDEQKIRELKTQVKHLSNEEADSRKKLTEGEKQRKLENENKDRQIASLKMECSKYKSELGEAKSEKAECIRKLNSQIASLELELTSVTHEVERSKEYIKMLEKQLQEQTTKAALVSQLQKELNISEMKVKSLECKLEADKEAALIARTRQSELKMLPELLRENDELKEELTKYRNSNVMLLEEKLWSLQEKLSHAEIKSALLTKIQAENELLKEKIKAWESLMDDREKSSYKSPSTFSRRLSEYQKNEVILTNKIAKLTSHCRNLNSLKSKLESIVSELKKENVKEKEKISRYENSLKLCQRKIFLLTKEQESSRKLIDSYVSANSETTFCGSSVGIQYVRNLEESLNAYKSMLEKVENEMKSMEQKFKDDPKQSGENVNTSDEVQKLREENAELLLKVEELQTEKIILEERLQEDQPAPKPNERSFKVIHMKHNLLDEAVQERIAEHQRLKEDNDRLRKRIKILEEEGTKAENVTMKVEERLAVEGSSDTIQGLTKKLNEAEKRCEVLKEAFQKASQELREACYMLTGYKIEVVKKTYKLYHMYADSPNDCLIFQLSDEGNLNLLENEYTQNMKERISAYLLRYDSIPAFLASITMDLFSHQTCVMIDTK